MSRQPQNVVIYLIGYPGTGKYTIAQEITAKAPFILVDNHLINNPVFGVIDNDGKKKLPPEVWDNVEKIRDVVLHTIEHIAPSHLNYILTNHIGDTPGDRALYQKIEEVFSRRDSIYLPVMLSCEIDEHKKRIGAEGRRERLKAIDTEMAERYRETGLFKVKHPHLMELDVTHLAPEEAADLILAQVSTLIDNQH